MVEPGELADDLAGAEVEEGVGDVGEDGAVPAERVVVGGPAPGALLAEQLHAVGDLVEPGVGVGAGVRVGVGAVTRAVARGAPVLAASSTARLSRRCRSNALRSQRSRFPSRCTRTASLASGCGQGTSRSAAARSATAARVGASAAAQAPRSAAVGTGSDRSGSTRSPRADSGRSGENAAASGPRKDSIGPGDDAGSGC